MTAKLTASDGAANDELGISVSVDGDTVVVGAHLHDIDDNGTSIPNVGAVYLFTKPASGGWADNTEGAKFTAPDGAANDEFGVSVAIDVDAVVVGAHDCMTSAPTPMLVRPTSSREIRTPASGASRSSSPLPMATQTMGSGTPLRWTGLPPSSARTWTTETAPLVTPVRLTCLLGS